MPKTLMCDPRLLQKDLNRKTYIVTGANSGAGLGTAKQLASQGATVVAACRRVDAANEAFADLSPVSGSVDVMELDLGSLASVRRFVETFDAKYDRLDGLANNAGIMAVPEAKTEDGFERQFGVNYLGHFLLTELLLDKLKASAPSRVACVSSVMHTGGRRGPVPDIHLDDLNWETREYDRNKAYGESKLAVVLYAANLGRRLEDTGVSAFSVHPGWIRSNLGAGMMPGPVNSALNLVLRPLAGPLGTMNGFEGAQTTLHCLLDDEAPEHSGEYYSQNSVLYPDPKDRDGGWPMRSPNPHAHDTELGDKLYQRSLELTGLA